MQPDHVPCPAQSGCPSIAASDGSQRSHNAQSALERESEASARRIGKEVQSVSLETPKDNNNNSTKVRALSYYCTNTIAMAPKLSPRQPLSARAQCASS